jgi:hypothetical protein
MRALTASIVLVAPSIAVMMTDTDPVAAGAIAIYLALLPICHRQGPLLVIDSLFQPFRLIKEKLTYPD